jgi:hypothetical protein
MPSRFTFDPREVGGSRLASSLHGRTVVIVSSNYLAIVGGVFFCAADQLISGA